MDRSNWLYIYSIALSIGFVALSGLFFYLSDYVSREANSKILACEQGDIKVYVNGPVVGCLWRENGVSVIIKPLHQGGING